jgi:hypothetical protein
MQTKSPIKRVSSKKVAIIHVCTQEDQIKKMSLLLLGNGNPKDGYVYKVMEMGDEMKIINEKLTGISGTVKELYDKSIGEKATVKTIRDIKEERRTIIVMWIKALSFLIVALGFGFTVYFNFTNGKDVKDTVKREIRMQEGVSKVTRGGYIKYNIQGISDSIKLIK